MTQNMVAEITLLVAEDDMFNRMLIVSMLAKKKNIKVVEAKDGLEALKILENKKVDILLLDLHMPKMDGFETLQTIRNTEKIENLPIMVISSDEAEKNKSLNLGANEFVTKPINLKELENKIYKTLERN